jgi:hypothetical protein
VVERVRYTGTSRERRSALKKRQFYRDSPCSFAWNGDLEKNLSLFNQRHKRKSKRPFYVFYNTLFFDLFGFLIGIHAGPRIYIEIRGGSHFCRYQSKSPQTGNSGHAETYDQELA